ncbi:MAG: hypothetical protein OXG88_03100 [Gammaproteobacteria bacterium]|nr:hypothetical protein [Gammaproteobacteria bacterium]
MSIFQVLSMKNLVEQCSDLQKMLDLRLQIKHLTEFENSSLS